jgi:hypothetical protein
MKENISIKLHGLRLGSTFFYLPAKAHQQKKNE